MKTLRVTLADLEGIPHATAAAATAVTVTAAYTGPVILTDGTIIPTAIKAKTVGSSGVVNFSVHAADDPAVREDHRGFAITVTAQIRLANGTVTAFKRTVKPLESMGSVVQLGDLTEAEGLPPQWVSAAEYVEAVVAAAAEGVAAMDRIVRDPITGRLYFDKAPVPPVFFDDFDRPDESPVSPTPIGGKPFLPGSGTSAHVTDNQLRLSGSVTRVGFWDAGTADGVYRITVADADRQGDNTGFGVIFRAEGTAYQDALIIDGAGALSEGVRVYRLRRRTGGTYGANTNLPATPADGDVLTITMAGPQVTIHLNGSPIYSDSNFGAWTGTHVGVQNLNNRNPVRFDNVSFEQIGA